jgi:hypothetical protein
MLKSPRAIVARMRGAAPEPAVRDVAGERKEISRVKKKILASAKKFLLQFRQQEKSGAASSSRNAAPG